MHRHDLVHEDPLEVGRFRARENTGRRGFAVYASTTPSVADYLFLQ